ncbi:hypothetical protein C8Q73DRAFT_130063 [Cubamyces lactineus]|nr:hypothetical protein C8Q73DRAFT_130063 [Cubamyces lactineus]
MKFFSSILPAVGVAMLGAISVLAQSSDVIINGLGTVTQESRNLRDVVENLTPFNVAVQGAKVASGLTDIGQTVVSLTNTIMQGNYEPFPDDVAKDIVAALTTFVQVHQDLLDTIIGKHGLLQSTPFTKPIGLALQSLEAIVDRFAYLIIGLIPTREDAAKGQLDALDVTFTQAINTYNS